MGPHHRAQDRTGIDLLILPGAWTGTLATHLSRVFGVSLDEVAVIFDVMELLEVPPGVRVVCVQRPAAGDVAWHLSIDAVGISMGGRVLARRLARALGTDVVVEDPERCQSIVSFIVSPDGEWRRAAVEEHSPARFLIG